MLSFFDNMCDLFLLVCAGLFACVAVAIMIARVYDAFYTWGERRKLAR